MRIKLTLAYNGVSYLGSQTQKSSNNTINGQIELVLKQLNIATKPIASGRTDKGVHATDQVMHLDIPEFWHDLTKLTRVMNEMLPKSIRIKNIKQVGEEFHARFGAKRRVYRYLIKSTCSNPFEDDFISFYKEIDVKKIKKNMQLFIGTHDFVNFMKTGSEVSSTTREVFKAFSYEYKGYIVLHFEATGYLRSQIRLMVGALLQLDATEIQEQLSLKKKHKIKPAKANGLYLAKIKY